MLGALPAITCWDQMVAIARKAGGFAVEELVCETRTKDQARCYLRFCLAQDAVEPLPDRVTRKGRHVILYAIKASLPPVLMTDADDQRWVRDEFLSRFVRTAREMETAARQRQLWTTLRVLKAVDAHSLAVNASTDDVTATHHQARTYLMALCNAGYVTDRGDGVFRLQPVMNTGPYAVLHLRGQMLDLNLMRPVNVTSALTRGRAA